MTLLEEYLDRHDHPPTEPARQILFTVLDDLLGRGGFDYGWDDADRETREEILETNLEKIKKLLP